MDQSIYDSFRWLDEDGDLDLSLDEYHSHVANSATGKFRPRLPSFRRSLSFSTHTAKHRPSPSMPIHTRAFPTSQTIQPLSPLPPLSPLSPISPRSTRRSLSRPASRSGTSSRPASRPASRRLKSSHAAKSSTSSIDPSAQYYYDPDARLKLRVYLASPQKFDEAIEFGFPSLDQIETHSQAISQDPSQALGESQSESQSQRLSQSQTLRHVQDKENISPEPTSTSLKAKSCAGTFFEDDDGNIVGSPGESIEEPIPSPTASPSPPSAGPAAPQETHKEITSPRTSTSTSTSTPQSFPRLSMRDIPRPHLRPSFDQTINKPTQPSLLQRRQSLLPQSKSKQPLRLPGNREMTLKMTLTRPDLREESPTPPAFVVNRQRGRNTNTNQGGNGHEEGENAGAGGNGDADDGAERDPLRLAELPPADRSRQIWDDLDEEQGVVRKMWRKLRRR